MLIDEINAVDAFLFFVCCLSLNRSYLLVRTFRVNELHLQGGGKSEAISWAASPRNREGRSENFSKVKRCTNRM